MLNHEIIIPLEIDVFQGQSTPKPLYIARINCRSNFTSGDHWAMLLFDINCPTVPSRHSYMHNKCLTSGLRTLSFEL